MLPRSTTGNYVIHVFSLLWLPGSWELCFLLIMVTLLACAFGEGVFPPGLCSRSSDASVVDWLRELPSAAQRTGELFAGSGHLIGSVLNFPQIFSDFCQRSPHKTPEKHSLGGGGFSWPDCKPLVTSDSRQGVSQTLTLIPSHLSAYPGVESQCL